MKFHLSLLRGLALFGVACGCCVATAADAVAPEKSTNTNSTRAVSLSARERRLQWNLDTLVGDYERHGHHDPKWDGAAKLALESFAQARVSAPVDEALRSKIGDSAKTSMAQGCDDPTVKYLYARFVTPSESHTSEQHAVMYRAIAEAMSRTERPPIRKFYAALRASEGSNVGSATALADVQRWRKQARQFLEDVARDKNTPVEEVFEAWDQLLQATIKKKSDYDNCYLSLEPIIFQNWPAEPLLLLVKGTFYTDYAWEARSSAVADAVTGAGWQGFAKRLAIAEAALDEAWKLNPKDERIARRMLTVELGQGRGRPRMEQWFERAMALNTNYYDACYAKLYYLTPKWFGSQEEMLTFAAECLNSDKWGGHVPLIVLDAHQLISDTLGKDARAEYCKRPEIWTDIKQALDKFFRLNPKEIGWHHNYALHAYRAEQWADLNRELGLLGKVNYDYFGGKEAFDKMVQAAKEHAPKAKAP